jgi:hypothetical protein
MIENSEPRNNFQEYTMPLGRVNLIALGMLLPLAILLGTPYIVLFGFKSFSFSNLHLISVFQNALYFILFFIGGIVLHELLHGAVWALFAKNKWKSISFGIKWEYFTPYCHCNEALKTKHFILGAIMPCIVMGLAPVIISYFNGSFKWWFFGFFFTSAAGGDLLAIWMLRKVGKNKYILDHPSELGFYVADNKPNDN